MGAGGNENNQWEWEGNGNKARLNLGWGIEMGINHWEWEGMGLKKTFPLISIPHLGLAAANEPEETWTVHDTTHVNASMT